MATAAQIQIQLDNATTALDKLMLGQRVEEMIGPDGTRVRYTATSVPLLREYIAQLTDDLARANGSLSRRPVYFTF